MVRALVHLVSCFASTPGWLAGCADSVSQGIIRLITCPQLLFLVFVLFWDRDRKVDWGPRDPWGVCRGRQKRKRREKFAEISVFCYKSHETTSVRFWQKQTGERGQESTSGDAQIIPPRHVSKLHQKLLWRMCKYYTNKNKLYESCLCILTWICMIVDE